MGDVYEKCTSDNKFKNNLLCRFDLKNHCTNYEGKAKLLHYHEAAYDAYMTGMAFMHILKMKEIELVSNISRAGA